MAASTTRSDALTRLARSATALIAFGIAGCLGIAGEASAEAKPRMANQGAAAAAQEIKSAGLTLEFPDDASETWVEITPLDPAGPTRVLLGDARRITVPPGGPVAARSLVCVGGTRVGTRCARVSVDGQVPGDLATHRGVRVVGRYLVGRRPADGASVSVIFANLPERRLFKVPLYRTGEALVRQVRCDAGGRFVIPSLTEGRYRLEVLWRGALHHSEAFSVSAPRAMGTSGSPSPAPESILHLKDLSIPEGLRTEFIVTDVTGRPLADAEIGAIQGDRAEDAAFFHERTNGRGRAVMEGFAPNTPVAFTCRHPTFLPAEQAFASSPGLVRFSLSRPLELTGSVSDDTGLPIPDATVSLEPGKESVKTGPRGDFAIRGLRPGTYVASFSAPGFRTRRLEVTLEPERDLALETMTLSPAEHRGGVVRDATTGDPIAGARVTSVWPPGALDTVSDSNGQFDFPLAIDEGMRLLVVAEGYPRRTVAIDPRLIRLDEPALIELARGGWIRALVWNEEEEAPCAGCRLTTNGNEEVVELETDARGVAVSRLLAPGDYRVIRERVRSIGSVIRVEGGDDAKMVTVQPGTIATVRFGEERNKVEVRFRPPAPRGWFLVARSSSGPEVFRQTAQGDFVIRRRGQEALSLYLSDGLGLQVLQGNVEAGIELSVLELPLPASAVQGHLLRSERAEGEASLLLVSLAGGGPVAWCRSSSDGDFRIPYLPPGSYALVEGGTTLAQFALSADEEKLLGSITLREAPRAE